MAEAALNTEKVSQELCPHCGTPAAPAHFCAECGKIQPLAAGLDYFSFFGLPRKLRIDQPELEKAFYSLSRQFHPDFFMSGNQLERQASVERSSMLNDAYRTLRDQIARVTYLLALEGYKEAEKKAPPDLLEEVFELNMQAEELKSAKRMGGAAEVIEARSALEQALLGLRKEMASIDKRLVALFGDWDSAIDRTAAPDEKKAVLDQISERLSHRSYISQLVRGIEEEL